MPRPQHWRPPLGAPTNEKRRPGGGGETSKTELMRSSDLTPSSRGSQRLRPLAEIVPAIVRAVIRARA